VQLRRLELVGFKTFPHRTELEFHTGITAIVGPNGSGKSNIFDGIRWALGETNARLLRGARMDDVIFAGSTGRRPHTLAQVALTLDNSSGLLPLEFAEVTVARTVTRGGDGEYAINGVDCRLRDIQMLFLGTGLGGRSYALIGQGEVDAVLRATPVERRQWLEEAAGLARHKRQRVEAERRLGHAQTHLDRLTDVLAELETQQQVLAAQAEAATLHRTYSEELRDLELSLFADEARRLLGSVRRLAAQLETDRGAIEAASARAGEAAASAATAEGRIADVTSELERGQEALLTGAERLSARSSELQSFDAQADGLRLRCDRLETEIGQLDDGLTRVQADTEALQGEMKSASWQRDRLAEDLGRAEGRVGQAAGALTHGEARLAQFRAEAAEAVRTLSQTHHDLAALRARSEVLGQAADAGAEKAAALAEAAASAATSRQEAAAAMDDARQTVGRLQSAADTSAEVLAARRGELAVIDDEARAIELDEHRSRARLVSIEEAHEQFAGFEDGVRAVLGAARSTPGRFPGLIGAVADLLDVPELYRQAIAAALGRRLHCLVTAGREGVDAVVSFLLEDDRRGAATVLSLEALRGRSADEGASGTRDEILARAAEVTRADGPARRLVEAWLSDVAIVADLDAAWRLFASGFDGRIATRDGALLSPDGVLSIRGWMQSEAAPLGRRKMIDALRGTLGEIEGRRAATAARRADVAVQMQAATDALATARTDHERAIAALADRMREVERCDDEAARLMRERRALAEEHAPRVEDLRRLASEIARQNADARQLEGEKERLDGRVRAEEEDVRAQGAARDAAMAEVTTCQVALVQLDGHMATLQARLADRRAATEDGRRRQNELRAERDGLDTDAREVAVLRERAAADHDMLLAAQAQGKASVERLAMERVALREDLTVRHAAREVAAAAQRDAEAALHRTEVRHAQAEGELTSAAARLHEAFGVTLEDAAGRRLPASREETQRRLEAVRTALRELGPVNLRAIDEHAAVTARYETLRGQTDDLRAAGDALRAAIVHINAGLRLRFRQTFEEVDREFSRLFQRLFEGGEGHLELVEMEEGAEPGLEVLAQLPGKTRRALVALSGGERVLVALALIFAMLRVHPSPFCIFDEVEAALDDANTKRFTTLLRDLAEQTQVLIITHNKGTMTAADILYGVTMQDPGISSLVSVRLVPQAEREARERADAERSGRETVALPAE